MSIITTLKTLSHQLSITFLLAASFTISKAQTVYITGNIPYAKGLEAQNTLNPWTMHEVRVNRILTVNLGGQTIQEKDVRSISENLGYHSPEIETKTFTGTLNMRTVASPAYLSILVDDEASLTIVEIGRAEGVTGPDFKESYVVNGTALWNIRSYKEFTIPLPPGRMYKLDLTYKNSSNLTPQYNGQIDVDGVSVYVCIVPTDIDIIHPESGEMAEEREDKFSHERGYVSVQRLENPAEANSDVTPRTRLKIHAVPGAQATWKTRLKFDGAESFKIYRDSLRKQEVLSEETEFDADKDTILYFHGLKKSQTEDGELVTMQVKTEDDCNGGDSVLFTVVQSEFLFQVKCFISYAWTEAEELDNLPEWAFNPMEGMVVQGDLHPGNGLRLGSPGFQNKYSTDALTVGEVTYKDFKNAPFRMCQTIILSPYNDLHATPDIQGERKLYTAPSSDTFEKSTSVNAAEMHLKNGFMKLSGGVFKTGKPPITI